VAALAARKLDVLVLHEPPALHGQTGNERPAALLVTHRVPLVAYGHAFWPQPLVEVAPGAQVLSVDSRCIVLVPRRDGLPRFTPTSSSMPAPAGGSSS
jgi:hypothetical protein